MAGGAVAVGGAAIVMVKYKQCKARCKNQAPKGIFGTLGDSLPGKSKSAEADEAPVAGEAPNMCEGGGSSGGGGGGGGAEGGEGGGGEHHDEGGEHHDEGGEEEFVPPEEDAHHDENGGQSEEHHEEEGGEHHEEEGEEATSEAPAAGGGKASSDPTCGGTYVQGIMAKDIEICEQMCGVHMKINGLMAATAAIGAGVLAYKAIKKKKEQAAMFLDAWNTGPALAMWNMAEKPFPRTEEQPLPHVEADPFSDFLFCCDATEKKLPVNDADHQKPRASSESEPAEEPEPNK